MAVSNVDPPRRKNRLITDEFFEDPSSHKLHQPFLLDLVTLEKIFFQNIPGEIDYDPQSNWNVVASPGRNTPLYQYTGAEDTISMTLSWYSDVESRQDVLKKCKMMEALSKNNGYDEKPHLVALMFGDLFRGARFIVEKAPYKLSMFSRPHGMLPQLATTELTLKRVNENNRSRADILKLDT